MYKLFITHNVFHKDIFCGHAETILLIPFPPFRELIIKSNNICTDLSCCWEGPIFDIERNQFEFTGTSIFETEEESHNCLKRLSENGSIVVYPRS